MRISESANQRTSSAGPIPVADRSSVVEELVTRRLVVVDEHDRERLVAEEDSHGELTLRISSRDNEAGITISVGDGDGDFDDGKPRVLMTVSSAAATVSTFVHEASATIAIERHDGAGRSLHLDHDGIELHDFHTQAVTSDEGEPQ